MPEETEFKPSRKKAALISILVMALLAVVVFGYKSTKDIEKREHPQAQLQDHDYYGMTDQKRDWIRKEGELSKEAGW